MGERIHIGPADGGSEPHVDLQHEAAWVKKAGGGDKDAWIIINEDLGGAPHREYWPASCCAFVNLQMDYNCQPSHPFL